MILESLPLLNAPITPIEKESPSVTPQAHIKGFKALESHLEGLKSY